MMHSPHFCPAGSTKHQRPETHKAPIFVTARKQRVGRVLLFLLLLLPLAVVTAAAKPQPSAKELTEALGKLKLGAGGYVVGARLTPAQSKIADAGSLADAFPGTIKFKDGDLFVVIDKKDKMILSLYQRLEDVGMGAIKTMIGDLMARFGEPTTMAHSKIIYWAYGPDGGKIAEDTLNAAKKTDDGVNVLATVKFSSSVEVNPGMKVEDAKKATIYYIISSQPLLQHFVKQ